MGVGLKPHLPDGTYTGTYRVISADTHIVYGGLVFNIGHAGAAPKFTVAGLIGKNETRRGHAGRLRRRASAELPDARADARRPRLPVLRLAARRSRRRRRRGALVAGLARVRETAREAARVRRRARRDRERARRPAAGRERRRRVAVDLAERLDRRKHAGKPLRQGVGRARDRLAAARRAAVGEQGDRQERDPGARVESRRARGPTLTRARRARCSRCSRSARCYLAITPALAGHASIESPVGVFFPSDVLHVARRQRVGRRDRLPAARAARRDAPARGPRAKPAAARDARALLAARARRRDRDRRDRRDPGLHRRAQLPRAPPHDLRRADHRQDRAAARR